jgi:hypothetical protein
VSKELEGAASSQQSGERWDSKVGVQTDYHPNQVLVFFPRL